MVSLCLTAHFNNHLYVIVDDDNHSQPQYYNNKLHVYSYQEYYV